MDVHHRHHPRGKNDDGTHGVSVGFTSHYRTMEERYGDHMTVGCAGENIIVETDRMVTIDDVEQGIVILNADGKEKGRLIDVDEPEKSLLLLKPLGRVKHGGGVKIVEGDQGYKAFRRFLEDYARTVQGGYRDAASLPREGGPRQFSTERWLKLANTPAEWGDRLLQVNVHAWDPVKKAWRAEPVATSDRMVWGKGKLWQHTLTLLAPAGYVYLEAGHAFGDATLRPLGLQAHRSGRAAAVHYHLLHRLPDDLPLPP